MSFVEQVKKIFIAPETEASSAGGVMFTIKPTNTPRVPASSLNPTKSPDATALAERTRSLIGNTPIAPIAANTNTPLIATTQTAKTETKTVTAAVLKEKTGKRTLAEFLTEEPPSQMVDRKTVADLVVEIKKGLTPEAANTNTPPIPPATEVKDVEPKKVEQVVTQELPAVVEGEKNNTVAGAELKVVAKNESVSNSEKSVAVDPEKIKADEEKRKILNRRTLFTFFKEINDLVQLGKELDEANGERGINDQSINSEIQNILSPKEKAEAIEKEIKALADAQTENDYKEILMRATTTFEELFADIYKKQETKIKFGQITDRRIVARINAIKSSITKNLATLGGQVKFDEIKSALQFAERISKKMPYKPFVAEAVNSYSTENPAGTELLMLGAIGSGLGLTALLEGIYGEQK